jgi:hypothetical protein
MPHYSVTLSLQPPTPVDVVHHELAADVRLAAPAST